VEEKNDHRNVTLRQRQTTDLMMTEIVKAKNE
jgi:hypothetical protein